MFVVELSGITSTNSPTVPPGFHEIFTRSTSLHRRRVPPPDSSLTGGPVSTDKVFLALWIIFGW